MLFPQSSFQVVVKIFLSLGICRNQSNMDVFIVFLKNYQYLIVIHSLLPPSLQNSYEALIRSGLLETRQRKWGRRDSNRMLEDNSAEDAEKEISKIGNKGIWRSAERERAGNGGRNWVSEAADRFIALHFLRIILPQLESTAEVALPCILNLLSVYLPNPAQWLSHASLLHILNCAKSSWFCNEDAKNIQGIKEEK